MSMTMEHQSPKPRFEGLAAITAPLEPHMKRLDRFMRDQVRDFEPEVRDLVAYCLKNSGKRIRPILVFHSGWHDDGVVREELVRAAAVIEFVHLATLVHDDILDGATLRHSTSTVSEKWGSAAAVLLGDALFAQALKLASDFPHVDVCRAVSRATRQVCSGEIAQTFQRGNAAITLEQYRRIIDLKTAELFHVSCMLGASLGGYGEDFSQAAATFGRQIGIAYQIFDDLADYVAQEDHAGKTLGTDLASGKFTLPLLLLLRKLAPADRDQLVENLRDPDFSDTRYLQTLFERANVIPEVVQTFQDEADAAEKALQPYLNLAPTEHLLQISGFVKVQIEKLVV